MQWKLGQYGCLKGHFELKISSCCGSLSDLRKIGQYILLPAWVRKIACRRLTHECSSRLQGESGRSANNVATVQQPGTSSPPSRLKRSSAGVIWMCRASFTNNSCPLPWSSTMVSSQWIGWWFSHARSWYHFYLVWLLLGIPSLHVLENFFHSFLLLFKGIKSMYGCVDDIVWCGAVRWLPSSSGEFLQTHLMSSLNPAT